jgi:hypothetical protein
MLALLLSPLKPTRTRVLPNRFDLEVTGQDITKGRRKVDNCPGDAAYLCPIAQALYRLTGQRWGVSPHRADLFNQNNELLNEYKHDGLMFTHLFDHGNTVQPTVIHFWKP